MTDPLPTTEPLVLPGGWNFDHTYFAGDWEPVGTTGTIEAFTILTAAFPGLPEPPLDIAFVTLDGADSAILNFVEGVDLTDEDAAGSYLFAHDRVRVVFSD